MYPYIHWQLDKWLNQQSVSHIAKKAINMLQDPTLTDERVDDLVKRIKAGTRLTVREKRLILEDFVVHARCLAFWNTI